CFSSRRRHTRFSRDWSSDVCSSDLAIVLGVVFTGQTLHFGEFADHIGNQIVFAQVGGALHHHFVGTQTLGDSGRQRADAAGFIRSEERRGGKEGTAVWAQVQSDKQD